MKIKSMKVKVETTVNPITEAVKLVNYPNNGIATMFSFSIKEDEDGEKVIIGKANALNCIMQGVTDYDRFAKNVMLIYYNTMTQEWEKRRKDAEDRNLAGEITTEKYNETAEIANCYSDIVNGLNEEIVIANRPLLERVCASAFSGIWDKFTSVNTVVSAMRDLYNAEITRDEAREAVNAYLFRISEKQDTDTVRRYWIKCNASLLEDIKARYYKGRTVKKSGRVAKQFDDKGDAIRKEVILAIIGMLQSKIRSASFGFGETAEEKAAREERERKAQQERQERQQERDNQEKQAQQEAGKAGKKTAKTLYRELCKKFHPDNKDTGNDEIFKEIQKAYEEKDTEALRNLYNKYM